MESRQTRMWTRRRDKSRGVSLLVVVFLALILAPADPAAAETNRIITLGESNSEGQRVELLRFFNATPEDIVATVTVAETRQAMSGVFAMPPIDSAYSSTALTCEPAGSGLDVTTSNIEVVSADLFAMALLTAGIDDATLVVAAPSDAPALGMTAMAGVFSTFEMAPCRLGSTNPVRQALALEQLGLTASIGQALGIDGGMQRTADIVLATQRAVVASDWADAETVTALLSAEETTQRLQLPEPQRAAMIELLTRLAASDFAWGDFSAGWTVDRAADGTQIRMESARPAEAITTEIDGEEPVIPAGVGGATLPRSVQATPPVATEASPVASPTASPPASPPASPAAIASSDQPRLLAVTGSVVERDGSNLAITEAGSTEPVAFTLASDTVILRLGQAVTAADLQPGDQVRLMVDPETQRIARLQADPAVISSSGESDSGGWEYSLVTGGCAGGDPADSPRGGALCSKAVSRLAVRQSRPARARKRLGWGGRDRAAVGGCGHARSRAPRARGEA